MTYSLHKHASLLRQKICICCCYHILWMHCFHMLLSTLNSIPKFPAVLMCINSFLILSLLATSTINLRYFFLNIFTFCLSVLHILHRSVLYVTVRSTILSCSSISTLIPIPYFNHLFHTPQKSASLIHLLPALDLLLYSLL